MIRRFNYTGRQRITTDRVSVRLTPPAPVRSFDAEISLAEIQLPPNAAVYLEAFEKTAIMRFSFGTVERPVQPCEDSRKLSEFEGSESFSFRVKVVDVSGRKGRTLAESPDISPIFPEEKEQKRRSLLPVRYHDIGEQLWKLEFSESQVPVQLLVNNRVPDKTALAHSPEFVSMALPSVLREILGRVLIIEGYRELDDDSDWKCNWLQFAMPFAQTGLPPESDEDAALEWIDGVVDSFCRKHAIYARYSKLMESS